ncbi:MAG: hypothetical protein EVG15_09350 [Candidatus Acididesulfobacter diazotrophicus]|uniref:Uncharacterized protein n=1 Tax=Candidatus Acididesulfobacter diazotrophicus TaxID=2597226 RepID=A0A519BKJ0_9DELT|nr:MAG: hypothetical protein EVG15_09350 [Candidatus Acididesulfobacter diazotrophicus]
MLPEYFYFFLNYNFQSIIYDVVYLILKFIIIYYLLPITYYLLPITYYKLYSLFGNLFNKSKDADIFTDRTSYAREINHRYRFVFIC